MPPLERLSRPLNPIELPQNLRAPFLKKPGAKITPKEEGWSPKQIELARILHAAFTETKDSFTGNPREGGNRVRLATELPKEIKVDFKKRTITYRNQTFGLPEALQIDQKTRTIRYIPGTYGANPATLAAATNKASLRASPYEVVELPSIYKAPPKPAQPGDVQAQPKTTPTTAAPAPTSKTTARTPVKTQTAKSNTAASAPEQTQPGVAVQSIHDASVQATAARVADTEAGIAQTLSQARNTLGQNITSREQTEETAVKLAKEYGVGTNIVGQTATEENNLNAQHVRGTEIFSKKTDGDTRILPAEPGQGAPGKKSR